MAPPSHALRPRRPLRCTRALLLGSVALLSACTGLRGSWTGDCDFSDGQYGEIVYLDLVIERDLGRTVAGSGTATLPSEGVFEVEVEGERTAAAAILRLSIPSESGPLDLRFEGSRDADELEGDCELWVPGATSPVVGVGELSR